MNNTKNNLIKSLRMLATDLSLVGEEQEKFVKEAMKGLTKEFDLVFDDEMDGTDSNK